MDGDSADITEQCRERVKKALASSTIFALRQLEVERHGDSLVLTGRVHSFYEKQLAQELIRDIVKESDLINSIDVG